jgi:transcriptional regulator with XRE-family HTH domain
MDIKLSSVIQERLEGKNLSAIAREIGISKSVLHDWAQAKRLPSMRNMDQVLKLADYLNLSLEELIFGKNLERSGKIISSVSFEDNGRKYKVTIEKYE